MTTTDLTFTILNFALGGSLFFLAVTVLRDNFGDQLNRVSGALFFFSGLALVFWALGSVIKQNPNTLDPFEKSFLYNLRYLWELVFPTLALFALLFPINRLATLRKRITKYLLYAPYLIHFVTLAILHNADSLLEALQVEDSSGLMGGALEKISYYAQLLLLRVHILMDSQDQLFSIINLSYAVVATLLLVQGLKRTTNVSYREQALAITIGIAVPVLIYVSVFVSDLVLGLNLSPTLRVSAMTVALSVFVVSFFVAILQKRFLNLGLAVRQSVVYTISTGALVGAYILVTSAVQEWIETLTAGEGAALHIAFVILALIFFQPINSQIDEYIQKLFLRSRSDHRNVIESVSRRLISVFEPTALRTLIEEELKTTLLVNEVSFGLYDDRLEEYVLEASNESQRDFVIDRSDKYLGAIGLLDEPTFVEDLSPYETGSELADERSKRDIRLVIPLRDADRLLGFIALSGKAGGGRYSAEEMNLLAVLSNQFVTSLTNSRLYAESLEKQRMEEDLAMARQIQIELLPRKIPRQDGYEIAAHSTPARVVGGDFYDFIPIGDGKIGIVIADASGKGMPAALLIAQIQAMLRSELNNHSNIKRALENVNNQLSRSTSSEKFVTLFIGVFDPDKGVFDYSNAGHNYPALVRADGRCEFLETGGLLVGVFKGAKYDSASVKLEPNDFIFLYTDGVSETMNAESEEFGERRLHELLVESRSMDPQELLDHTLKTLLKFGKSGPLDDDRTMIALRANHRQNS